MCSFSSTFQTSVVSRSVLYVDGCLWSLIESHTHRHRCCWLGCLCGCTLVWSLTQSAGHTHNFSINYAVVFLWTLLQTSHCLPSTASVFLSISFGWNSNGLFPLLSQCLVSLSFNLAFSSPHSPLLHLLPDLTPKPPICLCTIFLCCLLIQLQSRVKFSLFKVII